MSGDRLYAVRLESDEAIAEMMAELLPAHDLFPAIWIDDTHDYARSDFFCDTPEEAEQLAGKLNDLLRGWELDPIPEVSSFELIREDWAESWKEGFTAEQVSDRLLIRPSWEGVDPARGVEVITIDPGMSFGTGHHGTTRACLRFLDAALKESPSATVADLGCGTGILSIAAVKLGSARVEAIDLDPAAVHVAEENARLNGCPGLIDFRVADLSTLDNMTARIVLANILAPVLIRYSEIVSRTVESGGRLVLSGILTRQFNEVSETYADKGFTLIDSVTLDEWTSGIFHKQDA